MSPIEAIIQGIIQGITEFLPISSSGHLSISKHIFDIHMPGILFDIMLHLGTLVAVVFVYRETIGCLILEFFKCIGDIVRGKFKWSEMSEARRLLIMLVIGLVPLFFLFIPIPGTDMKIKDLSELFSTDNDIVVEGAALLVTALLLFLGIRSSKRTKPLRRIGAHARPDPVQGRTAVTVKDAIIIGITQFFAALFPGISRSGSTLSAGLMSGLNKQTALDYSFVLGIPAILAAAVVSVSDVAPGDIEQIGGVVILGIGVVVSAVVGFLAIKLLRWLLKSDRLQIFAYYTLIAGGIVLIVGIAEHVLGKNLFTGTLL
ncbi:undecaprenyl-diphosphate phosphatase [Scatolibacter rhodanostii]|uniref:undecaprenyl-diphosphate phosphatase n=1 Tax=Scatolibacter rhodanostii TaxID=2014781 RepID=UPI000C080D67|nr:undecaprenyl-diphosphate phosphatase [Scatolibacter rhodanostii]